MILPAPALEWLDVIVDHHGLAVLPLDLALCVRATALPPIHRDPADRLTISAALDRSLPVVTADSRFADYGVTVLI